MPDNRLTTLLLTSFPGLLSRPQRPFREAGPTAPPPDANIRLQRPATPGPVSVVASLREFVGSPSAAPAPREELLTAPALVEARLRALASREAPVSAQGCRGAMVRCLEDGSYALRVRFSSMPTAPYTLDIVGLNSVHSFVVERHLPLPDGVVAIAVPVQLEVRHRRGARRGDAPGHSVRFLHPAFPELEICRSVRDVSIGGLAFDVHPGHDQLVVGLVLHDVVVRTPSGSVLQFDAEVRRLGGSVAGLRLLPRSDVDAAAWRELVGSALCPRSQLGGVWSEDSWALYSASGYFGLSGKSTAWFTNQKAAFARATRKLDAAPEVGCQVAWPSESGIDATLSLLKVYRHSWFGFQMAKVSGLAGDGTPGRTVLRDIHLRAYEHAAADPDLRWVMGLVQDAAQWSKLVHHELPRRHVDEGGASLTRFHALEFDSIARARPVRAQVSDATSAEHEQFLASLVGSRPWAYRDALDLVPERFDLGAITQAWARAGLRRERALLVARVGGRPLAAALVEHAEPGLHLYNLLDVVRLYSLVPGGESTFPDLLEGAGAWYRARGLSSYTCLLEEGTPACAAHLRPRDLGAGTLTLLSQQLLPSFFEHLEEVTAPRLTQD